MAHCVTCCTNFFATAWADGYSGSDQEPLLQRDRHGTDERIREFAVGHVLGTGAFSTVRMGIQRSSGERFALKLVDKERSDADAVALEVKMLRRVGMHRHVVGLVDHFELARTWVLVLELVSGGEVFDRICAQGPYSELDAAQILWQVAEALEHMHSVGVAHRDVKPENLLLVDGTDSNTVKLCDFGLSCELDASGKQETARLHGTVAYMAPEYLREEAHGAAVDMWALGVVLYILLSGRHPFDPEGQADDPELATRIKAGEWAFGKHTQDVSDSAREIVRLLLEPSPPSRPTASQLLAHPWLRGAAPTVVLPNSHTNLRAFNQARRILGRVRHRAVTSFVQMFMPLPPPRPPTLQRPMSRGGVKVAD
tara:strand:+ start:3387 stop:4490 length:1104 start_codon:yes stop_codon:yes gene_type:complete